MPREQARPRRSRLTELCVAVFSFLRTVVMTLLRRGGYRSIRQVFRELAYDIKGMLALGGVATASSTAWSHLKAALRPPGIHTTWREAPDFQALCPVGTA